SPRTVWRRADPHRAFAGGPCRRHDRLAAGDAGDAMDMDEAMIVAGIGCRKGAAETDVLAAIDAALAAHGLPRAALGALAVLPQKQQEPAIAAAARTLGVDVFVSAGTGKETLTQSAHSLEAAEAGSEADAAAL